jgi:ferredoxin/flavodoxin
MHTTFAPDRPVTIYYFSGTGNTQLIAERIAARFGEKGFAVTLHRIEETGTVTVTPGEIVGIGFPVAAFSLYPVVARFIDRLPSVKSVPVFGFDTMGGTSLEGIAGGLRAILLRKGFVPVAFRQFRMPPNIFVRFPEAMCRRRMERSFSRADEFVDRVVAGKTEWHRVPVVSPIMYRAMQLLFKLTELRFHQKLLKIRVDHARCTRCGTCVRKCPVPNITLADQVVIGDSCQYCLRCVAVCPARATFAILTPRSHHYRAEGARL